MEYTTYSLQNGQYAVLTSTFGSVKMDLMERKKSLEEKE